MSDAPPETHPNDRDLPLRFRWKAAGKFFRDGETGETVFVKAVTWGPFPPDAEPDLDSELRRVRHDLGANALRVYEVPERDFLDRCAEIGLRVFVGFPWSHHVDFIYDHRLFWDEKKRFRRTVAEFRGHPAIAGWFVANEIPAILVRWMGPKRVNRALEDFLEAGREADPEALFAYANYPSTEYLCPRGQDFVAFNIYLENRDDYARYIRRIQHQAGDLPLLIAEFGLDSKAHGEEAQAETLAWHLEETARAGAAGTTLFAWSDRWFRGGETIEGWDFGLTRRDGSAKPAVARVAETWRDWQSPADALAALDFFRPKMSIVVCSYKGARLLEPCLASFRKLDYSDYEVLVINDGGDGEVAEVAAKFPEVRHVSLEPHAGLSAARNLGARESNGEIVVYTDDDCEADPDWLTWLAYAFSKDDLAAAGGPNIPPPPDNRVKAMVAAAPGGPAHVLLNDVEAEHLPGCNLAVRREVFEAIGGFDKRFRTAGDDVDFCWRLIEAGHRIGFHPAAMVWHHRRFTIKAYLKQQLGYGRAEALLMPLYPERFGLRGGARWKGRVYLESPAARLATSGALIYHGPRGYAPFQALYGDGSSHSPWNLLLDWSWVAVAISLLLVGIAGGLAITLGFGGLMLLASAGRAILQAQRATVRPPREDRWPTRAGIALLSLLQGISRSGRRFAGIWKVERRIPSPRPSSPSPAPREIGVRSYWWEVPVPLPWPAFRATYWSESGSGRDAWLDAIAQRVHDSLGQAPIPSSPLDGDLVYGPIGGRYFRVLTVTEYHEGGKTASKIQLSSVDTLGTVLWHLLGFLLVFGVGIYLFQVGITLSRLVIPLVPLLFLGVRRFVLEKSKGFKTRLKRVIHQSALQLGMTRV